MTNDMWTLRNFLSDLESRDPKPKAAVKIVKKLMAVEEKAILSIYSDLKILAEKDTLVDSLKAELTKAGYAKKQ